MDFNDKTQASIRQIVHLFHDLIDNIRCNTNFGSIIRKGNEGIIYEIKDNDDLVAKMYKLKNGIPSYEQEMMINLYVKKFSGIPTIEAICQEKYVIMERMKGGDLNQFFLEQKYNDGHLKSIFQQIIQIFHDLLKSF